MTIKTAETDDTWESPWYIVYLCGATDCFAHAAFVSYDQAIEYVKIHSRNPEGYLIKRAELGYWGEIAVARGKGRGVWGEVLVTTLPTTPQTAAVPPSKAQERCISA